MLAFFIMLKSAKPMIKNLQTFYVRKLNNIGNCSAMAIEHINYIQLELGKAFDYNMKIEKYYAVYCEGQSY